MDFLNPSILEVGLVFDFNEIQVATSNLYVCKVISFDEKQEKNEQSDVRR